MVRHYLSIALLVPLGAMAQPAAWSATAQRTRGTCGDRAVVAVAEAPGTMTLKFSLNGKQYAEVNMALAADGSGKSQFKGQMGQTSLEISPGMGKRPIKTEVIDGQCEWAWY